jgi:hypothetical protein
MMVHALYNSKICQIKDLLLAVPIHEADPCGTSKSLFARKIDHHSEKPLNGIHFHNGMTLFAGWHVAAWKHGNMGTEDDEVELSSCEFRSEEGNEKWSFITPDRDEPSTASLQQHPKALYQKIKQSMKVDAVSY